jgi:predicted dehydrogenase
MALSIVLVGCGKVADQHIGEIQKLQNARVVGVCDQEPLMAEQLAFRYGISKHYSDFDRMLEETKPDVVHVTTPPQTHLHFAAKALDAGCHIFVEKPLALDSKDAQRLIDYTLRRDRKMTIGYTYYFDPIARALRKMVRDDIIGEVVHVESFFGYNLSGPFGQPVLQDDEHWVRALPGGLLHNVIDHLLNKIIEFIPDQQPEICVSAWDRSGLLGLPDELRMMVRGREASGYATFSCHAKPLTHSLTVFGSKNTVHLDFVGNCITFETSPSLPGALGRLSCAFDQARQYLIQAAGNVIRFVKSEYQYFAGLNFLMSSFYDSIIENRPVPISYAEILRAYRLMDEVFLQMRATESLFK